MLSERLLLLFCSLLSLEWLSKKRTKPTKADTMQAFQKAKKKEMKLGIAMAILPAMTKDTVSDMTEV